MDGSNKREVLAEGVLEKDLVRDTCVNLKSNVEKEPKGNHTAQVVGIHMGTGCGKSSHLLLDVPKILKHHGIHITHSTAT